MFKHSPNGEGMIYGPNGIQPQWNTAPMEYSPNGKDIIAPMEYIPKFNSPNEKGMA